MKRIHVMAAVIERGDHILIARRPDHVHQGGKWEFPGGKLEQGEEPVRGLQRELHEELGIDLVAARPLIRIAHDYPDKQVLLDVWQVTEFSGEPVGREGQQVRWVTRDALVEFEFPAANVPIVAAARLPESYVISPDCTQVETFVAELEQTLASGAALVQIRTGELLQSQWQELLIAIARLRQRFKARFLLNSGTAKRQGVWQQLPDVFDGLHLTAQDLLAMKVRPEGIAWLAASCHSPDELRVAEALGVDFVTLSPVRATNSHPEAQPLGEQRFAEWVATALMPVYGLGGLTPQDTEQLRTLGAQGVAGISGLWCREAE